MFTGLVEEVGQVRRIEHRQHSAHIHIGARRVLEGVRIGDSISVNGACLTVVAFSADGFTADAVPETLRRTNLGRLAPGDAVNLERALALGDRLGGHLVSGHVDGVGVVRAKARDGIATVLTIAAPPEVMRYVVEKGSICVDGVSLTVMDVTDGAFRVSIIPHTGERTTLLQADVGREVNLEADLLAKYVEALLERRGLGAGPGGAAPAEAGRGGAGLERPAHGAGLGGGGLSLDALRANGFA
ncbi:riboflavin synthase [Alicyclobacillus macrosporangiidus]|uniref:Riboflavin synthase n=1 Tax=Alicyclobacillus macrosporangiidus TaxID=392015 RepID=A0A1I7GEY0_9BACL|nr:riboflavin synthase [Alicyclobacillus macrosporangiidus]SFU46995.1 riboflavin synthase [Alicyclobacillus macrosporangiidus]